MLQKIRDKIKNAGFYIPFTVYFVVFAIAALIGFRILGNDQINAYSSFYDIFRLLLKVALGFTVAMISIAFLPVLISFLHYKYHQRKKGVVFRISTDVKEAELTQKQTVQLFISPVLKPFFGFVKLRLLYDQKHYSKKFSLLEKSHPTLFSTTIEGTYHWALPQIKEYHIQKAILYFEDIFQFFSIGVNLNTSSHFFTQPSAAKTADLNVLPRKTEETKTRIDQLKKVEGEYLNYKNFENNDDVRRIVWKIYAKNKELVVRVPEIMDPYASHIYLYASFFNSFGLQANSAVEVPFLNYYKVMVWSVYKNLVKRGFEVRYVPDQDVSKNNVSDQQQWVKYSISTSNWHAARDLRGFVRTNDASIVIVSSLSNADQVKELADNHGREITFIFVKLTDSFKNQNVVDWVQWVFVKNQKDDIDVYKRSWALSPLRYSIKENEKKIAAILSQYQPDLTTATIK